MFWFFSENLFCRISLWIFYLYLTSNGDSTVKWCGNSLHKDKWFSLATDILEYFMCFDWNILIWKYWNYSFKYYCFQAHKYLRDKKSVKSKEWKAFYVVRSSQQFYFQ